MSVSQIGLILLIACVVAMLSRRFRLPYSVGLVAAGMALGFVSQAHSPQLTSDLIYTVLLPPLIFEAALQLKWRPFRRDLPVTLLLAFPGVLAAGALVAAGMHAFVGWGWVASAMFGALIVATDPVAVIAAFKETKVEPRLTLLVEAESLLNDGASAVAFAILVAIAHGANVQASAIVGSLLWMAVGGSLLGAAVAGAVLLLATRSTNPVVEITLTIIAAYGSFLLAEHRHMSGVLASLAAGLVVGNLGHKRAITPSGSDAVIATWDYIAFLANSVVFILIGIHVATQGSRIFSATAAVAVGLVLISRAVVVYPLSALFSRTRLKVDMRHQHMLFWGGLKGALALALALAIPDTVPEKSDILLAVCAAVAFSIFVQGLTVPWVVDALRLRLKDD